MQFCCPLQVVEVNDDVPGAKRMRRVNKRYLSSPAKPAAARRSRASKKGKAKGKGKGRAASTADAKLGDMLYALVLDEL